MGHTGSSWEIRNDWSKVFAMRTTWILLLTSLSTVGCGTTAAPSSAARAAPADVPPAPEEISPAKQGEYFTTLISKKYNPAIMGYEEVRNPDACPRLRLIQYAIRLDGLTRDPALHQQILHWLVREGGFLVGLGRTYPGAAAASPATSAYASTLQAWSAWLRPRLRHLEPRYRLDLMERVFFPSPDRGKPDYLDVPGLDPMQFGLNVMDDWIRAGHVTLATDDSWRGELFEALVYPLRDERGAPNRLHRWTTKERSFYRYVVIAPERRARLTRFVLERNDEALTEAVVGAFLHLADTASVVELVRAFEQDERRWREVMLVLAQRARYTRPVRFDASLWLEESIRLWKRNPQVGRRGSVLYVLTRMERLFPKGRGVPWDRFGQFFGAPIAREELAACLDQEPDAMGSLGILYPALSPGWSPAEVLVPRLDGWLDHPQRRDEASESERLLSRYVERLCSSHDVVGLTLMQDFLQARMQRHPAEVVWQKVLERASAPSCRPVVKRRPKRKPKAGDVGRTPEPPAMAPAPTRRKLFGD
jgi:hypothetical protein